MRRFVDRVKPLLGLLLAIALVVPLGAGLLDVLVFNRRAERVVDELTGVDAVLAEAVLLVRALDCRSGGVVSGTAFATDLDGRVVLLTNRHVVDDVTSVGLQAISGEPGPRVVAWRLASTADVAVLELGDPGALPPSLPVAADSAEVGDTVRTVGFPRALPFTTVGAVSSADEQRLDLDLEVEPGASGSPVVDTSGRVVGQVYARTAAGRGVATSLPALRRAVAGVGDAITGCG